MFRTIVAPIDLAHEGSARSCLRAAKHLMDKHGASLHLLIVVEDVPAIIGTQLPAGFTDDALAEAKARLISFAEEEGLTGENVSYFAKSGHVSQQIIAHAEEHNANLIVMASHEPVFSDYLLGSNAMRVVRYAHCSVLVLREGEDIDQEPNSDQATER